MSIRSLRRSIILQEISSEPFGAMTILTCVVCSGCSVKTAGHGLGSPSALLSTNHGRSRVNARGMAILRDVQFAREERTTCAVLRRAADRRCDPVSVLPAGGPVSFLLAPREGRGTRLPAEVFTSTINRAGLRADGATYNPLQATLVSIRVPAAARSFRGRHRHPFFHAEALTPGRTLRSPEGKNSPRTATSRDTGYAVKITKHRVRY